MQGDIGLHHLIGDGGGELRVLRGKLDSDDARTFDLIDLQLLPEGLQHPLFRQHLKRVLLDADGDQQLRDERRMGLRIELIKLIKLHVFRDLFDEIDRLQDLHLAGNGQFIENRLGGRIGLLRGAEGGRAGFDEHARLALIGGRHHA